MGIVFQNAVISIIGVMDVPDERIAGMVNVSTLSGLVGGAGTFFGLLRHRDSVQFTDEVVGELRKVTWPSFDETQRATTTVIITTLFVAALLYVYDNIWAYVASQFLFVEG
ncbi:MAG: preprotein translocase subunit SecE [Myxococcota bacterium]